MHIVFQEEKFISEKVKGTWEFREFPWRIYMTRNPQFWIFFGSMFAVILILTQKKKQWLEKRGVKVLCIGTCVSVCM